MTDTSSPSSASSRTPNTPANDKNTAQAAKSDQSESDNTFKVLHDLWPYLWPHDRPDLKRRVAWSVLALLAAKVMTVLVPYFYKWATDALTQDTASVVAFLTVPIMFVIAYGVSRIVLMGFNQLRDALFAKVGQHAVREVALETFRHLHQLSLRFHLQRRTGGLSRLIERGTKGIESIVRFTILSSLPTVLEFLLMAGIIGWHFDWSYMAVVMIMVITYVWFTIWASDKRIQIRREMNDSDTEANTKAIDSLLNFETVKYFGNERREAARFDVAMEKYEDAAVRTWTSLAWLNQGQTIIFMVGMMLCMGMSASAVMRGEQTLGDFVMINALLMQIYMPLNFIGFLYREIRQGLVDVEAMFTLMRQDAEVVDTADAVDMTVEKGAIAFNNVSFHYDEERPILKNISFSVPAGQTVALVGPSGAGKSTISRLLFRFYDVTDGAIVIDGQDVRDVKQESLRHAIGIVPQDTVLFNDTIRYNIAYGRMNADAGEVEEAASLAQISRFIEALPEGFETQVGERGLKLSGGEKQRVAIARTILKAPPILILDEATSALDTETERDIQSALDQVSKNRTTLVIAHRLSTVINADMILVLSAGEIVERGTHDELLGKNGVYASMWDRQRKADEARQKLRETVQADKEGYLVPQG